MSLAFVGSSGFVSQGAPPQPLTTREVRRLSTQATDSGPVSAAGSTSMLGHTGLLAAALAAFGGRLARRRGHKRCTVQAGRRAAKPTVAATPVPGSEGARASASMGKPVEPEACGPVGAGAPPTRRLGVLLLNIGTPESTSVQDVREYLGRFLADDRVLDVKPAPLKWLLLQIILATRPASSAEAYKSIFDAERGSPLLFHTEDLRHALQEELGDRFVVRVGMSYSAPFIADALRSLQAAGVDEVLLAPMFPQYASSTTGSVLQGAYELAGQPFCTPYLRVLPPFYDNPVYLRAMRYSIVESIGERGSKVDHVLFSFHGVPERQCTPTDDTQKWCLQRQECCASIVSANRNCYRAQCFESARLLAKELELEDGKWSIGFQSRLTLRGSIQWIRPYTDEILEDLGRKGVERLALLAPSFTADCVETLEELGIQGREEFEGAGGKELVLVPCLNSSEIWVKALAELVREQVPTAAGQTTSKV